MKKKKVQKEKLDNYLQMVKGGTRSKPIGKVLPLVASGFVLALPCTELYAEVQVRNVNKTVVAAGAGVGFSSIDIDNNGVREFSIAVQPNFGPHIAFRYHAGGLGFKGNLSASSTVVYPFKLAQSAEIKTPFVFPNASITSSSTAMLTADGRTGDRWNDDSSTKYVGVSFKISGQNHFGWIELQVTDVSPGPQKVKILRIAYEDEPNAKIKAGSIISCAVASVPEISIATVTASSVENSGTALQYRFTASAAPSSDLTINFEITSASSAANDDFTVTTGGTNSVSYNTSTKKGTIVIKSGQTTADLLIVPTGDAIIEDNETVIVSVTAP